MLIIKFNFSTKNYTEKELYFNFIKQNIFFSVVTYQQIFYENDLLSFISDDGSTCEYNVMTL